MTLGLRLKDSGLAEREARPDAVGGDIGSELADKKSAVEVMRAAGSLHGSYLIPVVGCSSIYHSSGRDINPWSSRYLEQVLDIHYASGQSLSILWRVLVPALAMEGLPVAPTIYRIPNSHIAL